MRGHLHGLHREGRRDRGNRKARCEATDELRVLSHKLAVVASAGVVSSFEQVLESLQSGFADGTLSDGDGEGVMNAVADLTIAMRSDVLHAAAFPSQNTERAVRLNSRRMEKLGDLDRHLLVSTDTREN